MTLDLLEHSFQSFDQPTTQNLPMASQPLENSFTRRFFVFSNQNIQYIDSNNYVESDCVSSHHSINQYKSKGYFPLHNETKPLEFSISSFPEVNINENKGGNIQGQDTFKGHIIHHKDVNNDNSSMQDNNLESQNDASSHFQCKGDENFIKKLEIGENHTLLLTKSLHLYSRGTNVYGQLGSGTTEPSLKEWFGPIDENVIDCAVGLYHSLYVKKDGSVFSIGRNLEGQCGRTNLKLDFYEAQRIKIVDSLPDHIFKVSCGSYHSILHADNGICYSFGRGVEGQLGILGHLNSSFISQSPTLEDPMATKTRNLSNGESVLNRRSAFQFCKSPPSMNVYLQQQPTPKPVKCLESSTSLIKKRRPFVNIIQTGCGEKYTAFLSEKGQVYMFGEGRSGVLGILSCPSHVYNPTLTEFSPLPPKEPHLARRISVEFDLNRIPPPPKPKIIDHEEEEVVRDEDCTYIIKTKFDIGFEKEVEEIETNEESDSLSKTVSKSQSKSIQETKRIVNMAIGWNHSILLDSDGEVYSSGLNTFGQCGQGHRNSIRTYTRIEKSKALQKDHIIQIGCGKTYSVLLTVSGELYVMGRLPGERAKYWKSNGDYIYPTALQFFKRNNLRVVRVHCGANDLVIETTPFSN